MNRRSFHKGHLAVGVLYFMSLGLATLAAAMHSHGITPLDLGVAGMSGFAFGLATSLTV